VRDRGPSSSADRCGENLVRPLGAAGWKFRAAKGKSPGEKLLKPAQNRGNRGGGEKNPRKKKANWASSTNERKRTERKGEGIFRGTQEGAFQHDARKAPQGTPSTLRKATGEKQTQVPPEEPKTMKGSEENNSSQWGRKHGRRSCAIIKIRRQKGRKGRKTFPRQ